MDVEVAIASDAQQASDNDATHESVGKEPARWCGHPSDGCSRRPSAGRSTLRRAEADDLAAIHLEWLPVP